MAGEASNGSEDRATEVQFVEHQEPGLRRRLAANGGHTAEPPISSSRQPSKISWWRRPWQDGAWVLLEVALSIALFVLCTKGALVGQSSEEKARSFILPDEQVARNCQKALRCVLVVICFTTPWLQKHKLFERANGNWPNMVFTRFSHELWLLPSADENLAERDGWLDTVKSSLIPEIWPSSDEARVKMRRVTALVLVVLIRALLGTARSFVKLQAHQAESQEKNICSGPLLGWIIFSLDVMANCGFILGFAAGRHYFKSTQQEFAEQETSEGPSATEVAAWAAERNEERYGGTMPRAPLETLRRPMDQPRQGDDEDEQLSPKQCQLPLRKTSVKQLCKGEKVDHGEILRSYAAWALLGLLLISALECWSLSYWEAAILGNRDDEVDVFRMRPYVVRHPPDFSRWQPRRVIVGSWRDLFYFVFLHPRVSSVFMGAALVAHFAHTRRSGSRQWFHLVDELLHRAVMGLMSYAVLLAAQRAYFAMSCLLICWECRQLEQRANCFARAFAGLSPRQRWLQHFTLTSEVKALQERLAPLIRYVFLQRLAYLALDVARQSCDASLPFNLVHYFFRHVMFLSALAITAWRIGKLNFSIYEKLHNTVMDLLPRNWADLGHSVKGARVSQQEVVLQRQHSEDWFRYLQHNIDTGRRDACICVFHLRFAAKSHLVALSALTLLTLPLVNKALEYYGKHVVNDRLLGQREAFLSRMAQTCAAEG